MVDPIIQSDIGVHKVFARLSTNRRDTWPSRAAAASKFESNKFYQQWDPQVLQKWIHFGLRDLPSEQYPQIPQVSDSGDVPVTLTTTTAQEVYLYLRAFYKDDRLLQDDGNILQDFDPADVEECFALGRPEMLHLYRRLPEIKPSVLYIFGKTSEASPEVNRSSKMELTGTGPGGSGGVGRGRVQEAVLDCGHLVGFEKPGQCAETSVEFIDTELARWDSEERRRSERWNSMSRRERVDINDLWRDHLGLDKPRSASQSGALKAKI